MCQVAVSGTFCDDSNPRGSGSVTSGSRSGTYMAGFTGEVKPSRLPASPNFDMADDIVDALAEDGMNRPTTSEDRTSIFRAVNRTDCGRSFDGILFARKGS